MDTFDHPQTELAEQASATSCPHCGGLIEADSFLCPHCGQPLGESEHLEELTEAPRGMSQANRVLLTVAGAAMLLTLLLAGLVALLWPVVGGWLG